MEPGRALSVDEAYRIHRGALMRYFQRNSVTAAEAEDLLQETYARYCSLENPAAIDNPRAFLFALARNALIDSKRRERVRADFCVLERADDTGGDTPERQVERDQELTRLRAAIEALPLRCRQVLILHRFRGLSHRQIAELLGITPAAVEKQMVRALKRCQDALSGSERAS
jgi:RNA polymerase sigma-70 factor (ECF subfamily)